MFTISYKNVHWLVFRNYSAKAVTKGAVKPFITCKRTEFNLLENNIIRPDAKFGEIPIASKGWANRKSKGDMFIIHPIIDQTVNQQQIQTFEDLSIDPRLIENLRRNNNITRPMAFQSESIPNILKGEHTLIAAETGCGKTYSYLIPIVQQILAQKNKTERNFNTPLGIILLPGRELADQIGQVAHQLTESSGLNVKVIVGGRTKNKMMNPEFQDIDLIIGTVGAVSKLVTTGVYRMNQVRHVVLDEADTLLDDSFNEKMTHFLKRFPFHKNHLQDLSDNVVGTQLILSSATMPTNVEELASQVIDIKTLTEVVSPNLHKLQSHVSQKFMRLNKSDRPAALLTMLKKNSNHPTVIFSNQSATSDFVSLFLNDSGINTLNFNGDMTMQLRVGRFERFQRGEINVLSSTDIGSRGLDTNRVVRIVNFDFPLHVADYIHRCGRVGRVGSPRDCQIVNFVSSQREIDVVQRIEHSARTSRLLPNVNANITGIIRKNIQRQIDEEIKGVEV